MDIYLIRHTRVNVPRGICYGFSDVGLHEEFKTDIQNTINKLPTKQEEVVIHSSDLSRCKLLAESISKDIHFSNQLRELNFGSWELLNWNDVPKNEFDLWNEDFTRNRVPDGESFQQLYERVITFLEEKILPNPKTTYLVTHSGVIRALIAYTMEIPLKNIFKMGLDYGSVSKLSYNSGLLKLEYHNH
jgi:alpha-ribazole phosphatase